MNGVLMIIFRAQRFNYKGIYDLSNWNIRYLKMVFIGKTDRKWRAVN